MKVKEFLELGFFYNYNNKNSGSLKNLNLLKSKYDNFQQVNLFEEEKDVNVVCGLLKKFLSGLGEELIPNDLIIQIIDLINLINDTEKEFDYKIYTIKKFLVKNLKKCNFLIMEKLFKFCYKVVKNIERTKMGYSNIMILIGFFFLIFFNYLNKY
jgi:hypothetical protein